MRLMFYSELVKALDCCAPEQTADDPNCSACPTGRDCGPGGQCWCTIEVMRQAKDAIRALMHDNAKLRAQVEKLGGTAWTLASRMEPPDDVLVWIRREPKPGHDEVVLGYLEEGRWYVNDLANEGGEVTHWMDYVTPRAPEEA